jgi:uncharacterized protein (DUF934 family)
MGNTEKSLVKEDHHTLTRFGLIAMRNRHVTAKQFAEATMIRVREELEKGSCRSIGEILVELGYMSQCQVEEVLNEMCM